MWMSGYTWAAQAAGDRQALQGGKYFAAAAEFFRGDPCHPYSHTAFGTHATFNWLSSCREMCTRHSGPNWAQRSLRQVMQLCNLLGHWNRAFFLQDCSQAEATLELLPLLLFFTSISCLPIERCGWPQSHDDAPGSLACRSASYNYQKSVGSRGHPPFSMAAEHYLCSQQDI